MTLGVNRVRYQAEAPFDVPSLISQRQTVAAGEQFRCCPKATSPKRVACGDYSSFVSGMPSRSFFTIRRSSNPSTSA